MSELPNEVYGEGVLIIGERDTNAKWPSVFDGDDE